MPASLSYMVRCSLSTEFKITLLPFTAMACAQLCWCEGRPRDLEGGGPLALFNIPHYLAPNMEIRDVDLLFEVNGSTILEANTFKRRAETRKYLGG